MQDCKLALNCILYKSFSISYFFLVGKFQTSLKINQNWDSKYADQSSSEYQNLKSRLDNQVRLSSEKKIFIQETVEVLICEY